MPFPHPHSSRLPLLLLPHSSYSSQLDPNPNLDPNHDPNLKQILMDVVFDVLTDCHPLFLLCYSSTQNDCPILTDLGQFITKTPSETKQGISCVQMGRGNDAV